MAACTPAKAPRSRSRILPPPRSSAGVPTTLTVRPTSSATRAAATPAPTAMAAIMLCPQAWPMPGRQSYSAHRARWSGPEPARATNAVGRSQTPRSTVKRAASSASAHQVDARSSSKASSGWAWMRWLSATRRSRLAVTRSRTPAARASAALERLEALGALAAIPELGRSRPEAWAVRVLPLIAQQVGDRLAARLLAQVAGVVFAPLLPAAERGVGPVRFRVEEEEPAAVEDQCTRLPPHPHAAQGAPGAPPVSSDQGRTRRLTQRSATTRAAPVTI